MNNIKISLNFKLDIINYSSENNKFKDNLLDECKLEVYRYYRKKKFYKNILKSNRIIEKKTIKCLLFFTPFECFLKNKRNHKIIGPYIKISQIDLIKNIILSFLIQPEVQIINLNKFMSNL